MIVKGLCLYSAKFRIILLLVLLKKMPRDENENLSFFFAFYFTGLLLLISAMVHAAKENDIRKLSRVATRVFNVRLLHAFAFSQ